MTEKLVCFIHSTNILPHRDNLVSQMLQMMNINGFLDRLDFVFINNIGDKIPEDKFKHIHKNIIVQNYSHQLDLFENCTIRQLHSFSKIHPEYKILYMHTKGVTYETTHPFYPGIQSWIRYFMYCLVEKVDTCIEYLKIYDTVSTNYQKDNENPHHYSGNFWWANANYLSTLDVSYMKDKYDAEFWILQNPKALWYNIYKLEHMYQVDYPKENYETKICQRLEENILYCKFGTSGIGLCNQLYSLVNTMVIGSVLKGTTLIVVDKFMVDLDTNVYANASSILDLSQMNVLLKDYGIHLAEKEEIQLTSLKVEYGQTHHCTVDITNLMMERFYTKNHLRIPKGTSLNELLGYDPCLGIRKQIYFTFTLNNRFTFHETRDEVRLFLHEDMEIDFVNWQKKPWMSRTSILDCKDHLGKFNYFLQNIEFQQLYKTYANLFVESCIRKRVFPKVSCTNNINIIHLRLEEDAIPFWSSINGVSCEAYQQQLENQYITNIEKHINRDTSISVILSMNTNNRVLEWMKENGYHFTFMDKTLVKGRETNAVIDLLISRYCTGVFIGNINPYNYHGSTFSYAIMNQLNDTVQKICIDTDDIYRDAYVV